MASSLALYESSRRSFVANVSHELKTPMTTISGFIDGILDGTIPPEKEKHYLEIVSNETKRLSRLVVAMLNISKIEAGELNLNPVNFNICNDIFNVLVSFEQQIEQKILKFADLTHLFRQLFAPMRILSIRLYTTLLTMRLNLRKTARFLSLLNVMTITPSA